MSCSLTKCQYFSTLIKQTPVQLLITVLIAVFCAPHFSMTTLTTFFTISTLLKSVLMLFLPFIIFFYLSYAVTTFQKLAPLLVMATITLIFISNATVLMAVYAIANTFMDFLCVPLVCDFTIKHSLISPKFTLPFSQIIPTEWGLILAFLVGIFCNFSPQEKVKRKILSFILNGREKSTYLLRQIFVPLLPLYIFGFVLKLVFDGDFELLIQNYSKIFMFCILLIITYLFSFYLIANLFCIKRTLSTIKNMLPAGLTGFSTMSSAATMPLTIEATDKNIKEIDPQSNFAQYIVPVSTNIHLIGDGLSIALTALALLYMSGNPLPSFTTYLVFTFWYCAAKFSTAGVPGAGVIIILPVMQKYLHLTPEMMSILTTIYILKDPILTGTNVMGNGAFALLMHRIFKNFKLI
ncbi:MAG: cation:dicarboxylase symporter family transporter [Proteobacteria bacterium]|nr:cation:dicarboxylase symporter family transporter [Pseudomonadota bacterium]